MIEIHQIKYFKDKRIKYIIFSYENESFKIKLNTRKFVHDCNNVVVDKLIDNLWSCYMNFEKDFNFTDPTLIVDYIIMKMKAFDEINSDKFIESLKNNFKDDKIEDIFKKELKNITS